MAFMVPASSMAPSGSRAAEEQRGLATSAPLAVPARAGREAGVKGVADMGAQFAGKGVVGWLRRNNLRAMAGWASDSIANENDLYKQTYAIFHDASIFSCMVL
jgi:hypothetical protein